MQEQPLQLLEALLERPGEVVTRDELRVRLWPSGVHVDFDNGINAAVGRLREALDDPASNPRFVATVPRRGYRFIAPVEALDGTPEEEPISPSWSRAGGGTLKLAVLVAVVLLVGILARDFLVRWRPTPEVDAGQPLRLAVLPFESLGADPGREYLGDALTEELIALLGRLQPDRLRIIARTSAMTYKGSDTGVDEIGHRLGVDYVLEGTVQQEHDAVRVTAALVEVTGQTRLWSASYDRTLVSLMTLEREIAAEVTAALALKLLAPEPIPPAPVGRSHELTLAGRYFLGQLTEDGFRKGIRSFEEACAEDPADASAHAGLAAAWELMGLFDFVPIAEAHPKARAEVTKALALDPLSAEAHLTLAILHFLYEWDFAAAGEEFDKALALNPSLVHTHLSLADYYASLGRHDEALASARRALTLDPLSLAVNTEYCEQLFKARRFEEAIHRCHRTIEFDPDFLEAWDVLKWIYIRRGDEKEAIAAFLRVVELEELHAPLVGKLREVAEHEGLAGLLRASLGAPEERLREVGQSPYNLVLDYAALGEVDTALTWLERSYELRETDLVNLAVDPRLDALRGDVRFDELARRVGLPIPLR